MNITGMDGIVYAPVQQFIHPVQPVEMMVQGLVMPHPLSDLDPRTVDLPGNNWSFHQVSEEVLVFCEIIGLSSPETPRVRKHVHVNQRNGICTSFVIDRKISEAPAVTKNDVERCIEELHMMHVCVGGPRATQNPPTGRSNARIDATGYWRHTSCKIISAWTGLPCNPCESLQYELREYAEATKSTKSNNGEHSKRVSIVNLSHRKQSQIITLRKRRLTWYRKKRNAEKEMKMIEAMISEVAAEEPEENQEMTDEDDD